MTDDTSVQKRVRSVFEDPSAQAVARVYSNSILGAATAVGIVDALEEFASFLHDVLARNPRFESILLSGIINRDDKISLIDRVVGPHGSELFASFLRVLARHDRLELLPLILRESELEYERQMGRQRVQVTSAAPLSESALERVRQQVDAALPFEPVIVTQTKPSLLAGLVIRIGDKVYDSSLSTRIQQLRRRLRERSLHEIQSGRDRFSYPEGN